MKIETIDMVGFGHWRNYQIQLDKGMTLIFGENEAGKTTLYHFIQTILFGFPVKRKSNRDYTPKDGGTYGGHLILTHPTYGRVRVSRFKGVKRHEGVVTLLDLPGQTLTLKELLGPLNEEVFKEVYTLEQQQLTDIHRIGEDKLQELLLTIGLAGSKQLFEHQESWQHQQQSLYKARGHKPEINRKLESYRELSQKISEKTSQEGLYRHYLDSLTNSRKTAERLGAELAILESEQKISQRQLDDYPKLEEFRSIKEQMSRESGDLLSQPAYEQLKEMSYKLEQLSQQEEAYLSLKATSLKHANMTPALKFYLSEEEQLKALVSQQSDMEKKLTNHAHYLTQQKQLQEQIHMNLSDLALSLNDDQSLMDIPVDVVSELETLAEKEQYLRNESETLNQRLTYFGTLLESQQAQKQKKYQKIKQSFILPGLLLGLAIILFFFNDTWALRLFFTALIIGVTIAAVLLWQQQQVLDSTEKDEWLDNQQQSERIVAEIAQLENDKEKLSALYQFDQTADMTEWLYQLPLRRHVLDLQKQKSDMTDKIKIIEEELQPFQDQFDHYRQWIPGGLSLQEKMTKLVKMTQEWQVESMAVVNESASNQWQLPLKQVQESKQALQGSMTARYPQLLKTSLPIFLAKQDNLKVLMKRSQVLANQLEGTFDLENYHQYHDKELLAQHQDNQRQYAEKRQAESRVAEEIRDYQFLIQQSESDGSLAELYQEEARLLDELTDLASQWSGLEIASAVVDDLLASLSTQRLPALLKTTSLFLNRLTVGNYRQCEMIDNQLMISNHDGVCYYLNELSTGTRDQLYLALRLAFIELYQGGALSPLIIDDAWLHYDSQRKQILFEILKELSQTIQVICLSSDHELFSFSEENNVVIAHL